MVFESVVVDVLNRFLGDYVENLDSKQLQIGIWGGDVVLQNLILKQNALAELDLPLQVFYGRLEKLVLKIPWKNLYGSAVEATIDGLYLLALPNKEIAYDAGKEEKKLLEAKRLELQRLEAVKRKEKEKDLPKADDTFVEKLTTQIIRNVQLTIRNIHVRYEDKVTNQNNPFALGVTLSNLCLVSTDKSWKPAIVTDGDTKIYKIVDLEGLAVYMNCNSVTYSNLPVEEIITHLKKEIASKTTHPDSYHYVLGPINSASRLRLNTKPECDTPAFSIPKIHLNVEMEKLFVAVRKNQYRDFVGLAESMDRMSKGAPYRKYRPNLHTYRGHYKDWWQFAYNCILEENVRKRRRNWDWNYINQHRETCRKYGELYQQKVQNRKLPKQEQNALLECEDKLDVFNVVLIRQRIELEMERLGKLQQSVQKKSWFSSWWKSEKTEDEKDLETTINIVSRFEEAMSADEKSRLYKAIDYQENTAPTELPKEFINTTCMFVLQQLRVELIDGNQSVLISDLNSVKCRLDARPAANAICFGVNIESLVTTGLKQAEYIPHIIQTEKEKVQTGALLDVVFETNPLDETCGQKLTVNIAPIRVTYDSKTFIKVAEIFKSPASTKLENLSSAAESSLLNIKEMSAIGLQHAIDQHTFFLVNINIYGPILILPHEGKYTGRESALIVNLGRLIVTTEPRKMSPNQVKHLHESGAKKDEVLSEMRSKCYDVYCLGLTELQIILMEVGADWQKYMKQTESTEMHLLNPMNFHLKIQKCLISDDPRLPLIKGVGNLPSLSINIADARLVMLVGLILSVPLPSEDELKTEPLTKQSHSKSSSALQMIQDLATERVKTADPKALLKMSIEKQSKDIVQLTKIDLKFIMSEFKITFNHQSNLTSAGEQIMQIKLSTLELSLTQQTFNTIVGLRLASVSATQFFNDACLDVISTPFSDTENPYLVSVEFLQVDKKSPEFHSKYNSSESTLILKLDCLSTVLHQEALLTLIKYITDMQTEINTIKSSMDRIATAGHITTTQSIPLKRQTSQISDKKPISDTLLSWKKTQKAVRVETIIFKLKASLNTLSVELTTNKMKISAWAVKGINSEIIIKKPYTQINAKLVDLSIVDLNPETLHKQIVTVSDEFALSTQIVLHKSQPGVRRAEHNPDVFIELAMGRIKIIYLNWFVTNILNFIGNFETAQEMIVEASAAAATQARQNMQSVYEKATKVSLVVDLKAPQLIVPTNSKSRDALVLNMGNLTLRNKFITVEQQKIEKEHVVVDDLRLTLTDFKLLRVLLDEEENAIESCVLLEPVTFAVGVERNLCSAWFTTIPDLDISGQIDSISLEVSKGDYAMVMSMLSGNLAEGQKAYAKTIQSKPIIMSTQSSEVISTGRSVMTDVLLEHPQDQEARVAHVFLKFTFTMNNFTVRLYEGGSAHSIASPSHKTMTSLGKLSVDGLSIKGRMMTDDSMIVSLILVDCELDDTRKERQGMLTRMIERSQHQTPVPEKNKADLFSTCKSMIDVTLQRTPDDMFADIRIFSFTVILAVEYLMRLAEFFQIEEPETKLAVAKSKTSNIAEQKSQTTVVLEPRKNPIQIKINIKVEKPDIILVEHMKNVNTDALILNCELVLHTRMVDVHQVISGTIKDIQVFTCCYNPTRRQETKSDVLSPITISVAGSTPDNQGLHLEVVFSPVRIRVSPDTIELLNNIIETMTGKVEKLSEETDDFSLTEEGESSIWNFKEFKENEHWFLKVDEAVEAFEIIPEIMSLDRKCDIVKRELCIVTAPVLVVTMEVGVGSKTHPMLLMECSFCGNINDWSSQMTVDASLSFQMEYYNSNLALWEPLIEPVEIHKNNKISYTPWELRFELTKSLNNLNDSLSPADSEQDIQPQPTTHISISSINNLEITVSQNCLDVLKNLGKAFSEAMKHDKVMGEAVKRAPYTVKNYLGTPVKLCLSKSSFCVFEQEDSGKLEVILQHGAEAPLELKVPEMLDKVQSIKLSTLSNADASDERVLNVKIDQVYCELNLPVKKADKRYFPLNYRLNSKESWGLVSDITAENGVLTITLRSILRIYNHLKIPVDAYYLTVRGNELECISTIEPGESLDVPLHALYSPTGEVFFSVNGFSVTKIPYVWRDLQQNLSVTSVLKCDFKEEGEIKKPAFLLKVVGEIEQVFFETTLRHTMNSTCYNMHLRPTVILKNCLPVKIIVCGQNTVEENELGPGENLHLPYVEPGNSYLVIRLPIYLEKEWSCRRDVAVNPPAFSVWEFNSHQGLTKATLDLGMHVLPKHDSIIMSLYCPFWMLNKTGLQLSYRSDENLNVLHHPPTFKGPILFSFNAKNFFGKKKAAIRVDQGQWSDKFSLDVAGSSGVIVCKGENMIYQIGVQNQLTYNGFTKQVTFTPFYVIINNAPYAIECQELDRPADPWIVVEKKSCTALWPKSERDDKLLRLRVVGTTEISAPFLFTESHTTLLKLHNKFAGIDVDIQMTEGGIYINLSSYEPGMAPALIMNHTKQTMHFWEKETVQIRKLPPMHSFLYTWENPSGPRILVWEIGHKKEIEDDLRKDGVGEFSPIKDTIVYWVSFLDGMQRVLLFTPDKSVAEGAQSAKNFELVQQEVDVSIHGMGLSLVKSDKRQEILYIGIASSGVIWESSKLNSKRFKQMKTRDCLNIEAAYQEYLAKSQVSSEDQSRVFIDNRQMEVDFNEGLMLKPHKRRIRRTFLTGLWLQMKSGPSQLQLHAKINRLQIDNQMVDCIFPVVLAPVPPPRSVAADFVHKPFVEVSIVQLLIKHSQIKQFKYFKILIQEFHIKVDLGFVNALVEMLQTVGNTESEELQQFEADMKLVDEPLYSHVFTQSLQEQKSFYDMLHFSPLKIHVSFSLATASGQPGFTTPNFLTVLLQGLGVTLTDMQDVVFKLAYFQREYNFLTKRQLVNETISHYMGQLVKQLYVLVLGLDVLGNPYGLVLGITKGVEDLFYEPFQGAIQGPGEFAEGVMLGVRSLFGHTVGGAAGAVSRITGAMGKGIAVLTFDDDFQRKRRDQINKKPASVQEGIARGGKGLVMGVVDGVTGVFTKPISGAMEQGVEGFFTGLGKGAVGLFTRPTAGVIDFASGSLDAVKRVTEMGEEVNRLRPPRFFHADGYIRPYNHHDAEGNKLLNELEKGKFASTDVYSCHYNIVGKKEILLFTDKRIAYITHNDIFGYWQVEWSYTWSELQQNPVRVDAKGVCVMAAESKKKKLGLFGGSDSGKLILIASPELKDEIARVIEQHRQAA